MCASYKWWWWLQHPSKDDEACAISGKRTTNSKLNTSIIGGCGVGVRIVDFFSNIRAISSYKCEALML